MEHINRRELIKTTGAGAGIALGAAAANGEDTTVTSSDPVEPNQEIVSTFGADAETAEVAIDRAKSEYDNNPDQILQEISTSEPLVSITNGEIYDNGDLLVAAEDFSVPDLIDVLLALDPQQTIIDIINGLDIYEDVINAFDLETDIKQPLIDFISSLDITDDQVTAVNNILTIIDNEFNLGLPLDLIPIDTLLQDPAAGIPELLSAIAFLADGVDSIETTEDLVIGTVGLINQLAIDDPANELGGPEDLLPFIADQLSALNLESVLSIINIGVQPDSIEGTVDPSEDPLLINVPLTGPTLSLELDVVDGPTVGPVEVPFEQLTLTFTTGTSGNLAGEFTGDTGNDTATGVIVDNQFTANITDFPLDGLLDELNLVGLVEAIFEIAGINSSDYPEFDIQEFVNKLDIQTLLDKAAPLELIDGLITDQPGRHAIRATLDMSFENLQAVFDDVALGPPPLPGMESPPQDLGVTPEGTYGDVNGDGEVSIFDVQDFFNNFDSERVKQNAEFFDFSETGGEPSIFDVQALFNDLAAKD